MATEVKDRTKKIVRTSIIGIAGNVLLVAFKIFAGTVSHSLAIITDALNNLSDAASSLVTIIGTKLAARPADKKHPFGYGRIEYLSAMLIGMLVVYAGVSALIGAIDGIRNPQETDYSTVTLIIVSAAVAMKVFLGRYFVYQGNQTNSQSLVNSGKDALFDSLISLTTLAAALIRLFTKVSIESYLAAAIALFIIKAGLEMIIETISKLLGEAGDAELGHKIRSTVLSFEGVEGAYDLVLNNYGPDAYSGSIHIAVPDTYTAWDIDDLIRDIQIKVYKEHNVILQAVGVYSINTKDKEVAAIEDEITQIAIHTEYVKQIHGFHMNSKNKVIRFDVVVSFDANDRTAVQREIVKKCKEKYPDYTFQVAVDTDYFES